MRKSRPDNAAAANGRPTAISSKKQVSRLRQVVDLPKDVSIEQSKL